MVKILLPNCNLEHLDFNSNSVFHYAAETTKEMINVSTSKRYPLYFSFSFLLLIFILGRIAALLCLISIDFAFFAYYFDRM